MHTQFFSGCAGERFRSSDKCAVGATTRSRAPAGRPLSFVSRRRGCTKQSLVGRSDPAVKRSRMGLPAVFRGPCLSLSSQVSDPTSLSRMTANGDLLPASRSTRGCHLLVNGNRSCRGAGGKETAVYSETTRVAPRGGDMACESVGASSLPLRLY